MSLLEIPEYNCEKPVSYPARVCRADIRYDYLSRVPRQASYPAESTLHHDRPDYMLGPERSINHEAFVTHNSVVHDRKLYRQERDLQPKHPQAPSQDKIVLVRPDYHMKIQGVPRKHMKAYNPCPVKTAETASSFKAHYPEADLYGPPGIFITDHFVHLPQNRVNVKPAFTYDDMFSVMRKAHPYMTTNRIHHKNFEDELPMHRFLDDLCNYKPGKKVTNESKNQDVAIKYRSRPMIDPFEQTMAREGQLPSLDIQKENPGDKRGYAHLKYFFRRPPYIGCLPRTFGPVPHVGMGTSYKSHYDRPLHPNMAMNWHNEHLFCYIQPHLSLSGLMRTPAMYSTENNIYGSGKNVSHYHYCDRHDPLVFAQEKRAELLHHDLSTRKSGCCYPDSQKKSGCSEGGGCGQYK